MLYVHADMYMYMYVHIPGFLVSCSYNTLSLRWEGQQCLTFDLPREHENVSTEPPDVPDDIL